MKKKIITVAFMSAIAIAAAWNVNQSENNVKLSDIAMQNTKALAADDSGLLRPRYGDVSWEVVAPDSLGDPPNITYTCFGYGGLTCGH